MNKNNLDDDLYQLTNKQLIEEVKKLRAGIRQNRDNENHELCWYNSELWDLLPEKFIPDPNVPCFPEFILNCVKYRMSIK